MRRREKSLPYRTVPEPGPFRIEAWKDPADPIFEFGDDATLRCVRRWLDAKAAWRATGGRSADPDLFRSA